MPITLDGGPLKCAIKREMKVSELLSTLGISREVVIVKSNGKIITEFDTISPRDNIELIRVSTGG